MRGAKKKTDEKLSAEEVLKAFMEENGIWMKMTITKNIQVGDQVISVLSPDILVGYKE